MSEDTKIKTELTEEQKEYAKAQVELALNKMKVKKVRIFPEIEEVSIHWVKNSPFFSEFLLRFNYFETESIPTMGVNSQKGRINLYINPKFLRGGQEMPKVGWFDSNGNRLNEDDDGNPIDSKGHKIRRDNLKQFPIFEKDDQGNILTDPFGQPKVEVELSKPLTFKELEGVLVHEIMHLIRAHGERALDDHYVWNISGDMLINNDIETMTINDQKLQLPKGAVYLKQALDDGYAGHEVTEPLYYWLLDKRDEYKNKMQDLVQDGQGQRQSQCNHCNGTGEDPNNPGEKCPACGGTGKKPSFGEGMFDAIYGSKIDDHSVMEESDSLAEQAIKDVIDQAKVRGWGNTKGNGVSNLDELCRGPKIPWKQMLRKYITAEVYMPGHIYENTWSRRNRRSLPLPGTRKLSNKIIIGVDTSGSISNHELGIFFTEVENIVKDVGQLVIVQWDTEVQSVQKEYKKGDWKKIKIAGRGGTHVQCIFDWMQENKMTKYPLVNFTDGWFSYDFENHGVKTIWCVTNGNRTEVPHGKNIHIEIKDYDR